MSITVKDREWDAETARNGPRYTTVRRYRIPDRFYEDDRREDETRIVLRERERERDSPPREYRIERYERDYAAPPPREYRDHREFRVEREIRRAPSPLQVREYRFEREIEREPEPEPYQLEAYSKSTEYYARPEPPQVPQPIIIHETPQAPIIIQERASQPVIIREEARPEPQEIIRYEPRPEPRPEPRHEEDYYYVRKKIEVDDGHGRPDRYFDEREYDSRAYSDDEAVYYRRERRNSYGSGSDSDHDHHKRHLAEGALAGDHEEGQA